MVLFGLYSKKNNNNNKKGRKYLTLDVDHLFYLAFNHLLKSNWQVALNVALHGFISLDYC